MMLRRNILAAMLALLAFAAPAGATVTRAVAPVQPPSLVLVTPSGAPVGGQWQQWVDQMRMPTVSGQLTFTSPSDLCGGLSTVGCSTGPQFGYPYELAASDRNSLYFELGHMYDWQYLTDANRRSLSQSWGASGQPWLDSTASLNKGAEDGLEAIFAAVYADCAFGRSDANTAMTVPEPAGLTSPQAFISQSPCQTIAQMDPNYTAPVAPAVHSTGSGSRRPPRHPAPRHPAPRRPARHATPRRPARHASTALTAKRPTRSADHRLGRNVRDHGRELAPLPRDR
jgi:hypothetical protein